MTEEKKSPHPNPSPAGGRGAQAGFTLLELLVVLVILGLLAAFAAPQVFKYLGGAKVDAAKVQINNLSAVLDLYRLDTGRYPSQAEGLTALVDQPTSVAGWNGPYVKKRDMLLDPWGHPYRYSYPGKRGDYDLYTLGADGSEGGSGENADAGSW